MPLLMRTILPVLQIAGRATIDTVRELDALALNTYVLAGIATLVSLLIAAVASLMVDWEPGANPRDGRRRRIIFWVIPVIAVACFPIYNIYGVAPDVSTNLQARFLRIWTYGVIGLFLSYFLLGFLISKLFPRTKLGSWFPSGR